MHLLNKSSINALFTPTYITTFTLTRYISIIHIRVPPSTDRRVHTRHSTEEHDLELATETHH